MEKNKNVVKTLICLVVVVTFSSIFVRNDAIASTNRETNFVIKPGTLSLQPSLNLIEFVFHETEQVAFADAGTLLVTDATGSGLGWHVNVKASPLSEVGKEGGVTKVLPPGSLTLSLEDAKITKGEGSGQPPKWVGGTNHIIDKGNPTTLLSADLEQGMGKYAVSFGLKSLQLKIPEDYLSQNSTYQSVITWSIQQGP